MIIFLVDVLVSIVSTIDSLVFSYQTPEPLVILIVSRLLSLY